MSNCGGVCGIDGLSGKRVRNRWVIYPRDGDNLAKVRLIPDNISAASVAAIKDGDPQGPVA